MKTSSLKSRAKSPKKIQKSAISSAIKKSLSASVKSLSGSGYASIKANSRTASKYFNPYIKKWEPVDSEDGKLLKIIIKNCYKCKDGYIYDIKTKRCVKITPKNRLEYEKIINFCDIYKREIAYRNKVDLDIIHKILNTQIDFENRKFLIKDIARLPDKFVDNMANVKGVDAVIANMGIFMAKLIDENPALGDQVKRKVIDVVNHSDESFSTLFLTLFGKKEELGLFKSFLLTLNPTYVLSIITGAVTSFAAIMSPLFNFLRKIKPIDYIAETYDKYKTSKIVSLTIDQNPGTLAAIKNDIRFVKNTDVLKDFGTFKFKTTMENLGLDINSKDPFIQDLTRSVIDGTAIIRFNTVNGDLNKNVNYNEYVIENPRTRNIMVSYINKDAKKLYVDYVKSLPSLIEKKTNDIKKYYTFQERINEYENKTFSAKSLPQKEKFYKARTAIMNRNFTPDSWDLLNNKKVSMFLQEVERDYQMIKTETRKITVKNSAALGFYITKVQNGTDIVYVLDQISNKLSGKPDKVSGKPVDPNAILYGIDEYNKKKTMNETIKETSRETTREREIYQASNQFSTTANLRNIALKDMNPKDRDNRYGKGAY